MRTLVKTGKGGFPKFFWRAAFAAAVMAPLAWLIVGGLMPLREKQMELRQMSAKVVRLKQKNGDLVRRKHLLERDRDYQERAVRKELGMVRPNETIFWLNETAE